MECLCNLCLQDNYFQCACDGCTNTKCRKFCEKRNSLEEVVEK